MTSVSDQYAAGRGRLYDMLWGAENAYTGSYLKSAEPLDAEQALLNLVPEPLSKAFERALFEAEQGETRVTIELADSLTTLGEQARGLLRESLPYGALTDAAYVMLARLFITARPTYEQSSNSHRVIEFTLKRSVFYQ